MAAERALRLLDVCTEYGVQCFLKGIAARLPVDDLPPLTGPSEIPPGLRAEIRVVAQRAIEAISTQSKQLSRVNRSYLTPFESS